MQATYRGVRRPACATPCVSCPIILCERPPLHSHTETEQADWNQDCTAGTNVSTFNTLVHIPTL